MTPSLSASPYKSIAVIGGGAWGTALAATAAQAGRQVTLYAREADVVESISSTSENRRFLPGIKLPVGLAATGDLIACGASEAILLAVPAQHVRETLAALRSVVPDGSPIAICAKGIEQHTGKLLTEVMAEAFPKAEPALLSGPSFALDVVRGLPTAVTIAAKEPIAARLQSSLSHPMFRPYTGNDMTGVALGGAAKNVYAIGCGLVDGSGLGESARAALLARGFAELLRLGLAMGAHSETLVGLSGLGDLVLTAMSARSRNYSFGLLLGQGKTLNELREDGQPLVEGAYTAMPLVERGRRENIELPVAEAVADVIEGRATLGEVTRRLMSRPMGTE